MTSSMKSAALSCATVANRSISPSLPRYWGMTTSWPERRWVAAMPRAIGRTSSPACLKRSRQPPNRQRTWSISRLRTSGCSSTNICASVDFPMPAGPLRWMNRATRGVYVAVPTPMADKRCDIPHGCPATSPAAAIHRGHGSPASSQAADHACRVSEGDDVGRQVLRHDRARAHDRVLANGDSS
jgi:hypothetical protein